MGHSSTYLAILVTQTLTVMTTASNKNFGLGDIKQKRSGRNTTARCNREVSSTVTPPYTRLHSLASVEFHGGSLRS